MKNSEKQIDSKGGGSDSSVKATPPDDKKVDVTPTEDQVVRAKKATGTNEFKFQTQGGVEVSKDEDSQLPTEKDATDPKVYISRDAKKLSDMPKNQGI